jgi:5-methylcytosine-specific restriction protein A
LGIPSGARAILRNFQVGDYLLLLRAVGPGGTFAYVGRAVAKPSRECFELSQKLWGEQRFPLILFLKGNLTSYDWFTFCDNLGYNKNWNPVGQTYRIQPERLHFSPYDDEDGLIKAVAGNPIALEPEFVAHDLPFQDDAELYFHDEEGRRVLRQHLMRERSSKIVQAFKNRLTDYSCCVCGFSFLKVYGELGRGYVEAHHTKPVASLKENETVSVNDLVPVCSNCHRMLHRTHPTMDWKSLKDLLGKVYVDRH